MTIVAGFVSPFFIHDFPVSIRSLLRKNRLADPTMRSFCGLRTRQDSSPNPNGRSSSVDCRRTRRSQLVANRSSGARLGPR